MATTAVASATAKTVVTASAMTINDYKNFEVRIVSGTGIGQSRDISSNSATTFYLSQPWEITPDATSSYQVWRDVGKIFLAGGGYADLLQYSADRDQWSPSKIFDDGQCNNLSAKLVGQKPFALTSITRTATGMILP